MTAKRLLNHVREKKNALQVVYVPFLHVIRHCLQNFLTFFVAHEDKRTHTRT